MYGTVRTVVWELPGASPGATRLALYRRLFSRILLWLNHQYPGYRWSAGDRSPWLVALGLVGGRNLVTVWTKSGAVYYGSVYAAPTREDDSSIVLNVYAAARRDEDRPHRTLDLFETSRAGPDRLMVFNRNDIDAFEIVYQDPRKGQPETVYSKTEEGVAGFMEDGVTDFDATTDKQDVEPNNKSQETVEEPLLSQDTALKFEQFKGSQNVDPIDLKTAKAMRQMLQSETPNLSRRKPIESS